MSRELPADANTPNIIARSMTRPPITPERMLGESGRAQVIYRSDAVHPRHQANFRVFDPLDFLAEVSAHIPDAHEKTTLLDGWVLQSDTGLPQAARPPRPSRRGGPGPHGRHASTPGGPPSGGAPDSASLRGRSAALSAGRWDAESHRSHRACLCRHGRQAPGGRLPAGRQVRQLLDHLGHPTAAPSFRAPPALPDAPVADPPREWSDEPLLDDLPIPDPMLASPGRRGESAPPRRPLPPDPGASA